MGKFIKLRCPNAIRAVSSLEEYGGRRFSVDVSVLMYRFAYRKAPNDDSRFLSNFVVHYNKLAHHGINPTYVFDGKAPDAKAAEISRRQQMRVIAQQRIDTDVEVLEARANAIIRGNERGQSVEAAIEGPFTATAAVAAPFSSSSHSFFDDTPALRFNELAEIEDEIARRKRSVVMVKPIHYANLRALFSERNIPYVIAPGEAEKHCARMCSSGEADVCVTEDFDSLFF